MLLIFELEIIMNLIFKRMLLLLLVLTFISISCFSQNIQIQYDYGKDRNYVTTTLEMYKPDKFGSTFWFVDFDSHKEGNPSISLSYFEIARYIKISGFDYFQPTIQYNDGLANFGHLGPAWLLGLQHRLNILNFGLNIDLLYRADYFSDNKDAQITLSWFEVYWKDLVFTGFLDIWSNGKETKKVVFLTEPQIWYNIWENLFLGMEVEISSNFVSEDLEFMPTIGLKWDFSKE